MGEQTEAVDPLTPETFSFFDVLEGIEYPEAVVELYMNERAADEQRKLRERVLDVPESGFSDEEKLEILDEKARIEAKLDASKFVFELSGVEDDLITDVKTLADSKFNVPRKAADGTLRQVLPEEKQMEYVRFFSATVNALHIKRITAPDGRVMVAPSADEVAYLYDKAPTSQKKKLTDAIEKLRVDASDFENRVDADF